MHVAMKPTGVEDWTGGNLESKLEKGWVWVVKERHSNVGPACRVDHIAIDLAPLMIARA